MLRFRFELLSELSDSKLFSDSCGILFLTVGLLELLFEVSGCCQNIFIVSDCCLFSLLAILFCLVSECSIWFQNFLIVGVVVGGF